MFANGREDRCFIAGRVIQKIQNVVLDSSLFNAQLYKVRINGKWTNRRKGVALSPKPRCRSYWKRSLRVTPTTVGQLTQHNIVRGNRPKLKFWMKLLEFLFMLWERHISISYKLQLFSLRTATSLGEGKLQIQNNSAIKLTLYPILPMIEGLDNTFSGRSRLNPVTNHGKGKFLIQICYSLNNCLLSRVEGGLGKYIL